MKYISYIYNNMKNGVGPGASDSEINLGETVLTVRKIHFREKLVGQISDPYFD